ncbi:MAG: 50S ribosomal protein L29 [Anaerolineae bacterium]|nr:50S ribosomal protein L29 [Anaerolineae bacterium]
MPSRATEIRQMNDSEILQAIEDAKEEQFNLRFQWESGQLEDYTPLRQLKKNVARYLTVLRERELAAALVQEESYVE